MTVTVKRRVVARPQEEEREVTLVCSSCETQFVHERRKGRLPAKCPECREKPIERAVVVTADNVIDVERNYREHIEALKTQFGGPNRDLNFVPPQYIHTAREMLRRDWCAVYGRRDPRLEEVIEDVS